MTTSGGGGLNLGYELDDRFRADAGPVVLTGIDALVRLPLAQARRDRAAGLLTGGFVSGYRGSPLGGFDLAMKRAEPLLAEHAVHFVPGVNEDLAATAVWGTQVAQIMEGATVDGVFAMWYGKGPGVDRSTDPLKHGNYAGSSASGGVLVVAGDDHAAKSSSLPHQSDHALIHCGIPILTPATVEDVVDFGLAGWAASRYSGAWVALRCITEVIETSMALDVDERTEFVMPRPEQLERSSAWLPPAVESERDLFEVRLPAMQEFVRANELDRVVFEPSTPRLGIVTAGKSYIDVRRALVELGLDEAACARLGLSILKLALTWPIDPVRLKEFAEGLDEILVVEEKRPVIEEQVTHVLHLEQQPPRVLGKRDRDGRQLLPSAGEITPRVIAESVQRWLERVAPGESQPLRSLIPVAAATGLDRKPAFCAGCPHNTSTVVPEGSHAFGGIGCHGMVVSMPDRNTPSYTHMGGEGANWIGISPFTTTEHVFQNMGDGTYFHSGLLAIRAAVAAGVNITYKILANGAVAMTGGQVIEGESIDSTVLVPDIVAQLRAEGVKPIVVVSDEPSQYGRRSLPHDVELHHRDDLDEVQEALREARGVSAIVYDQTCAAEARRLRKKGKFDDPDRRILINELVCEGCGDCSVQSNCIAIEPVETPFGRKRTIDQTACNKDVSCLKGYCPSFAIVEGGQLRQSRPTGAAADLEEHLGGLPDPVRPALDDDPYNIVITGIGGAGVVTIGAVLGMAAHLDGLSTTTLDLTGLAQKNGAVSSHLRIASRAQDIDVRRISTGMADALVGCDLVVAASPPVLDTLSPGRTQTVVNVDVAPTADFAHDPDLELDARPLLELLREHTGAAPSEIPAATFAEAAFGDGLAANFLMLGFAFQKGLVPVSEEALLRATELNGVAVERNQRAFALGRLAAHKPGVARQVAGLTASSATRTVDEDFAERAEFLTAYQNRRYADRYRRFVDEVREREASVVDGDRVTRGVIRYLFKLMAYKDEYEVARLYTTAAWREQVSETFEGDIKVRVNLAPQILTRPDRRTGRVKKRTFGPWIFPAFEVLRRLKVLRGTPLDIFGRTAHRRRERQLIDDYTVTVRHAMTLLASHTIDLVVELVELPEMIRGYGTIKDDAMDKAEARRSILMEELARRFHRPAAMLADDVVKR